MNLHNWLLNKDKLSSHELSDVLIKMGYKNRLNRPSADILSKMLEVSYRQSSRMVNEVGISGVYYSHFLFQLGIKKPEYASQLVT